ncbi:MAG: nucleotidyltransferase family protein [Xanthomonadaceae bacterium]|jgi:MurNAc alpha-1-phosphate uridylyltransferase|nr:nucleotidyltransferase family protein [Xanthomonadaceae bacterium]
MKALIFAAGFGNRMRPLTEHTPKPLLPVADKPLIVWHLEKLAALGIRDVVINTSWLAEQFPHALGDGAHWGLHLHYLYEGPVPLETGGGMLNALTLLGDAPFLLVNGDIWTDFDFTRLPPTMPESWAHLVMVDPPAYATQGNFVLSSDGYLQEDGAPMLTYSGIGLYRPELLIDWQSIADTAQAGPGKPSFRLAPILRAHMAFKRITGQHHRGHWTDVGTPERLAQLEQSLHGTCT